MSNNQKYIIRCESAGVFYAGVESRTGDEAVLTDCRRVWQWSGATDCIDLAVSGCDPSSSRLTVAVASMTVLGVIEVIPVTDTARERLEATPIWRA